MKLVDSLKKISKRDLFRATALFVVVAASLGGVTAIYLEETNEIIKGKADFDLTYRFRLTNEGPLNLTSVSLRLALLKSWDPIQEVNSLIIKTPPNYTTTDEHTNEFAWYEFQDFKVNQSIDLQFEANLTLNILDYAAANLPILAYNTSNEIYQLYTSFHPLTDTNDLAIQQAALNLGDSEDPLKIAFGAYNFTSTYLNYRLLSSIRGASFALRNGYGDCDEYTTLFIALARARGIPAIEHTAWLADFVPGFETTDEGAVAHAYPMFYLEGTGMIPADPTRGNTQLYDNWAKTDEKRITLTRGPDQPYRLLTYRWIPIENAPDPNVVSNYTISIWNMNVEYSSILRFAVIIGITAIPIGFVAINIVKSRKIYKQQQMKLSKLLSPEENRKKEL